MSILHRAVLFAAFVCVVVAWAAKPADVEVTEMKLRREGDLILVDTTVRNTSARPIKGLVAIFRFYSVTHEVMSSQRTAAEEPVLEPGAQTEIHAQLSAPPKSVSAEFSAEGNGGRGLRAENSGPFPIE